MTSNLRVLSSKRFFACVVVLAGVAIFLCFFSNVKSRVTPTETSTARNELMPKSSLIKSSPADNGSTQNSSVEKDSMRLVICTRLRNEAPYMREWIEYHHMIGFDFFVLLNNKSTDETQCVLDAYADAGLVKRIPEDIGMEKDRVGQREVFDLCAKFLAQEQAKDPSTQIWMATHDTDEFLWYNTNSGHATLKHAIRGLVITSGSVAQSIAVPRLLYGSSWKKRWVPTLVINRFKLRYDPSGCTQNQQQQHQQGQPKNQKRQLFEYTRPRSYCDTGHGAYDSHKSISLVSALALECYTVDKKTQQKVTKEIGCHSTHDHVLRNGNASQTEIHRNHTGDPRYLDEVTTGPTLALAHYMTKSREEFYQRICESGFKDKYYRCPNCTLETYYDLAETYANNYEDRRMRVFVDKLMARMNESSIGLHCDTKPVVYPWKHYKECLSKPN